MDKEHFSILLEKYKDCVIIVEGKKDVSSLESLGFKRVYALHQNSMTIRETIEQIIYSLDKKDVVCILTDSDKKGTSLYHFIKPIFQEHGVKLDHTLHTLVSSAGISHVEGLYEFLKE